MSSDNVSAQDKLDRLYTEKRITREDYDRLQQSLEVEPRRLIFHKPSEQKNCVPWQVWTTIGVLVVATLFQAPHFAAKQPLVAFTILILNIALVYGLYQKHRWAFILCLFFCFSSLITVFKNPGAVLVNLVFGFILLTAYPYFFGKTKDLYPN